MMLSKEHLTEEGLRKIVAIKATLNRGLSSGSELDQAFPDIIPVQIPSSDLLCAPRPLEKNTLIQDPYWLAGFTEGEGCFFVVVQKSSNTKTGKEGGAAMPPPPLFSRFDPPLRLTEVRRSGGLKQDFLLVWDFK